MALTTKSLRIALFAIIAAIALFAVAFYRSQQRTNALMASLRVVTDSVTHYRDQYGIEHARRLAELGDMNTMSIAHQQELKAATDRLNVKTKQIEGLQSLVASVRGQYTVPAQHQHDSVVIRYHDSTIAQTTTIVNDTAHIDYNVTVPIHVTQYWERSWFLGRKRHVVDAYSDNPNACITGLTSVTIRKEPGRFGIGPYIGYSIAGPSIGIALTYSLIRF